MNKKDKAYVIKDYGKKSVFSSFLPGISGICGTPIWCYYVNRGQCVVSFGVENKDHAIMEFFPAHQAYQNVKSTGFRTFIKQDNVVWEAFSEEEISHTMSITMNGLKIEEVNKDKGIKTSIQYVTLPGEAVGALIRSVTLENVSQETVSLEVIDGMPAMIPYGVNMDNIKNMGQTVKAWMQVEDLESKVPYFRVRASIADTAAVKEIAGGNFAFACTENGSKLAPIVDPKCIFDYDNSLRKPLSFEKNKLEELVKKQQAVTNQFPCAFFGAKFVIKAGEKAVFYEMIGQVNSKEILHTFLQKKLNGEYFKKKQRDAVECVESICKGIETHTASESFDAYCDYTYMDNVLRGGYPIQLGHNKVFYVYSRKHGDLERDYNYFSMVPEFYSQGNGNFRDVNQNRRCDTFFAPFVGRENIKRFYNLIQLDGYNPLAIEKQTYRLNKEKAQKILKNMDLRETLAESLEKFVTKPFTPGALYQYLQEIGEECEVQSVFTQIIDFAEGMLNASFGEGYWTDHWTYNLDLIMDYLEIYPEQEEELLYEKEYICFKSQAMVKPRHLRYAETEKGLRQYHAIQESNKKANISEPVRDNFGQGAPFKMTLLGKLVLLCATKFATLDPYGMGIEMEGGKPGWYDALNGMPAIFGSSMAETYELCRMLEYTIKVLQKHDRAVELPSELAVLLRELDDVNRNVFVAGQGQILTFWNRINEAKEAYRARIYEGISGKEECLKATEITNILNGFLDTVQVGIRKACKYGEICPTYFTYEVKSYKVLEQGYMPLEFEVQEIPYFLEGPVRYLKLSITQEEKKQLYGRLKKSDLYDKKLGMYKVNASLQHASYELGRAKAFTPGWLENESIWLHMEYKYLLELLRSGLYQEFFEDFHQAAVPFLNPEIYGRSIYENSSFIASSCNPDESVHGKGFVARLSGSTIEFISMWKYMMFGKQIFSMQNGEIVFSPVPVIPRYLIPENKTVCTTLLGKTRVVYHLAQIKDYIPGQYKISAMRFLYKNNSVANVAAATAGEKLAKDVRDGEVSQIDIYIE